jgi:hypothetical protein
LTSKVSVSPPFLPRGKGANAELTSSFEGIH